MDKSWDFNGTRVKVLCGSKFLFFETIHELPKQSCSHAAKGGRHWCHGRLRSPRQGGVISMLDVKIGCGIDKKGMKRVWKENDVVTLLRFPGFRLMHMLLSLPESQLLQVVLRSLRSWPSLRKLRYLCCWWCDSGRFFLLFQVHSFTDVSEWRFSKIAQTVPLFPQRKEHRPTPLSPLFN